VNVGLLTAGLRGFPYILRTRLQIWLTEARVLIDRCCGFVPLSTASDPFSLL